MRDQGRCLEKDSLPAYVWALGKLPARCGAFGHFLVQADCVLLSRDGTGTLPLAKGWQQGGSS